MTVVNTNPMYTARELKHQLVDSGASAIVVLENFAHTVDEVLPGTSVKKVLVTAVVDLLKFYKGAIVNFMLRHVKKQIPAYKIAGAIGFREACAIGDKKKGHDVIAGQIGKALC